MEESRDSRLRQLWPQPLCQVTQPWMVGGDLSDEKSNFDGTVQIESWACQRSLCRLCGLWGASEDFQDPR